MRVTERVVRDSALRHLQAQLEGLARVQEQIASGKRVGRPGDEPVASGEILDLRSDLQTLDTYDWTIEASNGWIAVSDTALRHMADLVTKARAIALRGSTSTNESVLPELADEAEKVLEQAVSAANSRYGDDYVFAGYQTGTTPFSLDLVTLTVTYLGDSGTINREVEPGHQLQINVAGDTLLPALEELATLVGALRSGDISAVADRLDPLENALDQVVAQASATGLAGSRIEVAQERLDNVRLEVRGLLSGLEDTDVAEAAVDLNSREQGYQATLVTIARATRQTLMDYLG